MASCFTDFSTGAIFGGIEPVLGSLSPPVSGGAYNVEDNDSFMYSRFFSYIFLTIVSHLLLWLECCLTHNYNLPLPIASSLSCPLM